MMRNRLATRSELAEILGWAAREGWNPGLDDAKAFHRADPEGFFVAVDAADMPVAAISVVNHSAEFAFLGLYIVRPDYRGRGIGLSLWQHALGHAGDRTVGLDGVEAQQANYVASGFAHAGRTTRFTGEVGGNTHPNIGIVTGDEVQHLIGLESSASGVAKEAYLQAWFTNTANRMTLVSQAAGKINGFCTVRHCLSGAKIGPLLAESDDTARALIAHATTLFEGPVTLDVPEAASALAAICGQYGMEPGFRTARMYRGAFAAPKHPLFAVTSLELG